MKEIAAYIMVRAESEVPIYMTLRFAPVQRSPKEMRRLVLILMDPNFLEWMSPVTRGFEE